LAIGDSSGVASGSSAIANLIHRGKPLTQVA
jgi:hypothetical protein